MRTRRAAIVIIAALAVLLPQGCNGDEEATPPDTAFADALATAGEGVAPSGIGFGWVAGDSVRSPQLTEALGPGVDDLFEDPALIRRKTGLDPATATGALSIAGSYAFGVRIDGVSTTELAALYRTAGARESRLDGWTALDLGVESEGALRTPLEALGAFGSRAAVRGDAAILARFDSGRLPLIGAGESPLRDPGVELAARCLGEVVAARIFAGIFTHQRAVSPELIAVGVRPPGRRGSDEVLCAIDDSEKTDGYATAMEAAFASGASDPVTERPIDELFAGADVETFAGTDGLAAARATLTPAATAKPGELFDALSRGSVVTYLGAPAPIPAGVSGSG